MWSSVLLLIIANERFLVAVSTVPVLILSMFKKKKVIE